MGQVIVDSVRIVEIGLKGIILLLLFLGCHVVIVILSIALLNHNFGSQLLEKTVGLAKKLFDLVVLLHFDQFEVSLHVLLLESLKPYSCLLVLNHLLLLLLHVVVVLGLVSNLLLLLMLLPVPLQKLLLVYSQVLQELFVLNLLPPLMITLHLTLYLLSPALVPVTRHLFSPKVAPVKQLLSQKSSRACISGQMFSDVSKHCVVQVPEPDEDGIVSYS